MCNTQAISLGLSGAEFVTDKFYTYKQDQDYIDYQNERNKNIMTNYVMQTKQLNNNYAAEQASNALQRQQDYLKNLQAKSSAQAAAAAAGINGNSIDNLFKGYDRISAVNNYISARDLQSKGIQYNDRLNNLRYSAAKAINTQQPYTAEYREVPMLLSQTGGLFDTFDRLKKRQKREKEDDKTL